MAEHFAKAIPALLADPNLTDGDVRVYLAILSHADWDKLTNCYPSLQLIATTSGKRRSVVIKHIASLIKHGWIARSPRFDDKGQAASLYAFPKQPIAKGVGAKSSRTLGAKSSHDQEPSTKPRTSLRSLAEDEPNEPASFDHSNRPKYLPPIDLGDEYFHFGTETGDPAIHSQLRQKYKKH